MYKWAKRNTFLHFFCKSVYFLGLLYSAHVKNFYVKLPFKLDTSSLIGLIIKFWSIQDLFFGTVKSIVRLLVVPGTTDSSHQRLSPKIYTYVYY